MVRLFRNETNEWYHIHVNGEEIICTGGHPFYLANLDKFIPAKELKLGDTLLLSDNTCAIIEEIQIEQLSKPETTYNFEVEDFHTYYVTESKVLVHNTCAKTPKSTNQAELTDDQLRNFGERGKNSGFRQVNGTQEEAMNFVRSQTSNLSEYDVGKFVGYNSRGVEFRIYSRPMNSYTSIRINGVNGLKGIKFMWPA